jgi:hypothetical protein
VKENEMGRACSMYGEKYNVYRLLVRKPEGRPRCRWKDNIEVIGIG